MLGQVLPQLQTFIEENCTGGVGGEGGGTETESNILLINFVI